MLIKKIKKSLLHSPLNVKDDEKISENKVVRQPIKTIIFRSAFCQPLNKESSGISKDINDGCCNKTILINNSNSTSTSEEIKLARAFCLLDSPFDNPAIITQPFEVLRTTYKIA